MTEPGNTVDVAQSEPLDPSKPEKRVRYDMEKIFEIDSINKREKIEGECWDKTMMDARRRQPAVAIEISARALSADGQHHIIPLLLLLLLLGKHQRLQ